MADAASYTPPELARRYGIKPAKVLAWISRGELRAINLAAFEAARAAAPPQPRLARRRRADTDVHVKYF